MTILVDELTNHGRAGLCHAAYWCHMTSDTSEEELHMAAMAIGLKRAWYQDHPHHPHYDITSEKRRVAIKIGAVEVNGQELARRCWKNKWLREKIAAINETQK